MPNIVSIRAMGDQDHAAVVALNNANVPAVGPLDGESLVSLLAMASHAGVADVDGHLAGCFIVLPPGQPYASLNYRWFASRMVDFAYLDRIMVEPRWRRHGVGRACYQWLFDALRGTADLLCCEVNIRPLNQGSLDFHHALGFNEVGQQDTDAGAKRVALLARQVNRDVVGR